MTLDSSGNLYLTGRVTSPDFPISAGGQAPKASVGLVRSQDRANTWASAGSGVGGSKVFALTADPKSNAVVYAGTSRGVFRTADAGLTWKPAAGLPNDTVTSIAIDPGSPATVYACMSEGLYQSTDSGATWKNVLAVPVLSVALSATKPGLVYVGRVSAPIMRSLDAGTSWQEVSAAVTVNSLAVDPTNALTVYAATSRSGVYLSTDGGTTWAFSNTGISNGTAPLTIYTIAIDPRIPQRLYAATGNGLFRSSDGGSGWTPGGSGIGTRTVLSLAINPQDGNFVYAGTAGGGVFRSSDGGDTWVSTGPASLDANALAVDAAGEYVHTGLFVGTQSFVTKVNPSGSALVYSTYIGGTGTAEGRAIALDSTGRAYVCGTTDASDFPNRNSYQASIGGSRDAFFLRLNPLGSDLDYASFFGGHGDDVCENLALDTSGNVYLSGNTYMRSASPSANDFPTTPGAFQRSSPGGGQDCFVAKFDDTGRRLTWSTYLGGSANDACYGLAVDRTASVYLSGTTLSPNFPLLQPSLGGVIPTPPALPFSSAFVTRMNSDGADLSYSALLGGLKGDTEMDGLALDSQNRVYMTGFTKATDYPVTANALSVTVPQRGKTVVAVVDPNFNRLVYSTLLPGTGADAGSQIRADVFGNAWIVGTAFSGQFPVTADALPHAAAAGPTPYLAQVDVAASKILHATFLAGNAGGMGNALALASDGTVFVGGAALSTDFAASGSSFQTTRTNDYAVFLQHLDFSPSGPATPAPAVTAVVNGASFGAGAVAPGSLVTILGTNLASATDQFGSVPPTTLAGASVSINGQNIPLFYASPTQINAQVPFETPLGAATLKVTVAGASSAAVPVTIGESGPGVFLVGTNRAAVTNADGQVNTSANPTKPGDAITVYFTGVGPLDNPVPTGEPAPLTGPLSRATLPVTVTIGGQTADILFVGLTPGSISLAQANVLVPNLPGGEWAVVIKAGSATSNGPLISVTSK
jgi:uncharacterized protein (TIGR03437 family)